MSNFWSEAAKMVTSGLLVAAVVLPVAFIARALRPKGEPLLPRWEPWRVPWNGFAVIGAFFVMSYAVPSLVSEVLAKSGLYQSLYGPDFALPDTKDGDPEQLKTANNIRQLWVQLVSLPITLGVFWFASRTLYPEWKPTIVGRGSTANKIWLAVIAWVVITPTVLLFHAGVSEVFKSFGVTPEEHALTKLGNNPLNQVLIAIIVCVVAPLSEELLFRGILLPWCVRRTNVLERGVTPGTIARPWFVLIAASLLAVTPAMRDKSYGPAVFLGLLVAGLGVMWYFRRTGVRRTLAVYATAALFAMMHVTVWPTPIPLFVLGLALGWLALRTNGILVPVLVHALFNAVSAVLVLRNS